MHDDGVLVAGGRTQSLAGAPSFVVLHGEDDPIIPPAAGLRRLDRLVARGVDVTVKTFPGVPHWIMRGMKTALHHTLRDGAGAAGGQAAGAPTTSR